MTDQPNECNNTLQSDICSLSLSPRRDGSSISVEAAKFKGVRERIRPDLRSTGTGVSNGQQAEVAELYDWTGMDADDSSLQTCTATGLMLTAGNSGTQRDDLASAAYDAVLRLGLSGGSQKLFATEAGAGRSPQFAPEPRKPSLSKCLSLQPPELPNDFFDDPPPGDETWGVPHKNEATDMPPAVGEAPTPEQRQGGLTQADHIPQQWSWAGNERWLEAILARVPAPDGVAEDSPLRELLPRAIARLMQRAGIRNPLDLLLERADKEAAARVAHVESSEQHDKRKADQAKQRRQQRRQLNAEAAGKVLRKDCAEKVKRNMCQHKDSEENSTDDLDTVQTSDGAERHVHKVACRHVPAESLQSTSTALLEGETVQRFASIQSEHVDEAPLDEAPDWLLNDFLNDMDRLTAEATDSIMSQYKITLPTPERDTQEATNCKRDPRAVRQR